MTIHRTINAEIAVWLRQNAGLRVTRLNRNLPSDVLRVAIGGHTVTRVPVRWGSVRSVDVHRLTGRADR